MILKNRAAGHMILLFTTMVWGMGFIGTRWTLLDYGPMWSNSFRYVLAGLMGLPYLIWSGSFKRGWKNLKPAMLAGMCLFLSMLCQVYGLVYTTVAKSGFITTFYAFFTPILCMLIFGARYQRSFWGLLGLALTGVFLMCDLKLTGLNIGDFLTLLCAFFGACHILVIDRYAKEFGAFELNALQCFFMGIVGVVAALIIEGPMDMAPLFVTPLWRVSSLMGFVILALFSSMFAFTLQVYAQKTIPPHQAALIFLMESLFAASFGYFFFDEKLTTLNLVGCALILLACALVPKFAREIKRPEQVGPELLKVEI